MGSLTLISLSPITFLPKSIAVEAGMLSEAQNPITLRICLAGPGWGGGTVHGKGRQAAKGWWIWMRGARREGQGSREGFPLGWMVPSLPTRTRQVPDPILALSAALERGWGCRSLCAVPAGSRNQCTELVPGIQTASEGRLHPQSRTQPWGKLSWICLEPPHFSSSTLKESLPGRAGPGPTPFPER